MFNAFTSRLTPAAVRNSESDSDTENVHGNVTTERMLKDHNSDGSSNKTGLRFSREFNDEGQRSPGQPRHPQIGVLNAEYLATDPRNAFPTGALDTIGLSTDPRHALQSSEIAETQPNSRFSRG